MDIKTQDIVHALLLKGETEEGFEQLIREAILAGYPLRGLSSDLAPGLVHAHENYFAKVPLQACRIHFGRRLDQVIPKAKGTELAPLYAEVKARIRAVLYAGSEKKARELMDQLLAERARYGQMAYSVIASLARNFDLYMTHHHHEGFPADNNTTENVIKQLGKKLRLMGGVSNQGIGGELHPAVGGMLPLQALHRLAQWQQRQGSVGTCRSRSDRSGLVVVSH